MATTWVDSIFRGRQFFVTFISEEEVTENLTGGSKADAFMRLMGLKPKGHYEMTIQTNGCLSPMYRVYKEITCSPRLVESKGNSYKERIS